MSPPWSLVCEERREAVLVDIDTGPSQAEVRPLRQ